MTRRGRLQAHYMEDDMDDITTTMDTGFVTIRGRREIVVTRAKVWAILDREERAKAVEIMPWIAERIPGVDR